MSDRSKVMLDEIQSWLNCKIESVSVLGLTNRFHAWFSNIMGAFTFCSQGHLSSNINMNDPKLIMCLKTAIKDCQKAPLKALKLLRLPMNDVIKLLPIYPNMKIIHLLRDPRGIMNSRFNVGEVTEANFQEILEEHCAEVENNLKFSKTILNKYSNRLKIIIYEDLAERPLETARSLVKFAGLLFNKSMQKFILNQTHAPCDDDTYSTQRKSSTETAYKWRTQMDPEKAKFIYNMCKESNRILGYLPLASVQALRNLTIPSRQKLNVAKELFKNKF